MSWNAMYVFMYVCTVCIYYVRMEGTGKQEYIILIPVTQTQICWLENSSIF